MTGKSTGKSNRPRRRKSASTEYAPGLNPEHREAARVGRDRQENAEATAKAARSEAWLIGRARGQMRNAREEVGEAVQLFQLRYPDRVPADDADAFAKPLALALRLFTTSVVTAKGKEFDPQRIASRVARHLRRLLPLASSPAIANALDFRQYLGTGKWPNTQERSAMLGVTAAECLTIGARHLKASDLTKAEWKNRLARLDYASLSPEEKAERNAVAKTKRAAEKAKRHQGTPAFIAERVTELGAKLDRTTVQRWIDKRDGALREKVVERIAQVKDRAAAERIADVILGKFNDAKRSASKGMSAVGKKRRRSAATKAASAVGAAAPLGPAAQASADLGAQNSASDAAADASEVVSAAYTESGQTQALTQVALDGGGQALSLPPVPLDIVTVRTTREEPMSEQTTNATARAAGPHAALTSCPDPLKTLSELKALASGAGDVADAAILEFLTKVVAVAESSGFQRGVTEGFAREKAMRDRGLEMLISFRDHPAYGAAWYLIHKLAQADRSKDEINAFVDRIDPNSPPFEETEASAAATLAIAFLQAGMEPAEAAIRVLANIRPQPRPTHRTLVAITGGRA